MFLALKKEFNILQPVSQKGTSDSLKDWKSVEEIAQLAQSAFIQQYPNQINNTVSRIDVRPGKGIAKVLFEKGYWEVQVDGTTGAVLSMAKRHSDWIESLHDGSIISDGFKLISMNLLGLGVLFLIATGLWLRYGPGLVKKSKRKYREEILKEKKEVK